MPYTKEMALADKDISAAMAQWQIVQTYNRTTQTRTFTDHDARLNGKVVPTWMDYKQGNGGLEVTHIQQGDNVIYGRDASGTCHATSPAVDRFFVAQPQMEAVFHAVPSLSIAYGRCR